MRILVHVVVRRHEQTARMGVEEVEEREPGPLDLLGVEIVVGVGTKLLGEDDSPPEQLWHYTDSAGAMGILRQHELWATHALFMNDASELRLAYPLLREAIEVARARDTTGQELARLLLLALEVMLSDEGSDPEIYATCFCEEGDLLSQWRAYARSGSGYALGFDAHRFKADAALSDASMLRRVIYDPDEQRGLAQELVDGTVATFLRYVGQHDMDVDAAIGKAARAFRFNAQAFSYQIKNEAFREEREWRLIYARKIAVSAAERDFRAAVAGLVPFVRIPLLAPSGRPEHREELGLEGLELLQVNVGPSAQPEVASLAMQYLLVDLGLTGTVVTASDIPLRS